MSKHKIVVGLGFGDEGKGTIVDYLTAEGNYDFVVRFSGGPQAAHNVVTDDGRHHTFAQFGSGSFNGVPTILTRHMMVNPFNLAQEAEALADKVDFDPFSKLIISENSLLVTTWHMAINQLVEIRRGENRHGSCGQGIGVAQKFALDYPDLALRVKDMYLDRDSFIAKAQIVRELLKAEYGVPNAEERDKLHYTLRNDFVHRTPPNMYNMFRYLIEDHNPLILTDEEIQELIADSNCVWEGSQGVLLDEWKGFHPYTTWSTTTSQKALEMLSEAGVSREDVEVVGVTRTYHTRHGAGPFPTEDEKLLPVFPEAHNAHGEFQGGWRVGALDLSLLYYAIHSDGEVDSLAVTHLDVEKMYVSDDNYGHIIHQRGDLEAQERLGKYLIGMPLPFRWELIDFGPTLHRIVRETDVPISIMSYGPRTGQKWPGWRWYGSQVDTA